MRLLNIECARGLAALAVVLFHALAGMNFLYGSNDPTGLIRYGEHGVDFFFVLSGFIITYVHAKDIGMGRQFQSYAMKRIVRLYPLIWIVAIPWIFLRIISGDGRLSVDVLLTSLLLVPSQVEPVPIVLWTLRHEVLFYAAFGLLIFWRHAIWLVAIWVVLCIGQLILSLLGHPIEGLAAFLLSSFNLQFLLGAAVGYMHRHVEFRRSIWPLLFGGAVVVVAFAIEGAFGLNRSGLGDYTSQVATSWVLLLGLAFAMLLHGLLTLPTGSSPPAPLVLLGSASFAIYLAHVPVITVLQRLLTLFPREMAATGFGYVFLVVGAVVAGILLHLFIERPVTNTLRRMLLRPRVSPSTISGRSLGPS